MDTSAILGFKQPDQTQNLASLLNVANGAQNLQRGQLGIQREQLGLQNDQTTLNQRLGMIDYIKSGDALDPDGSLNPQRLYSNASKYGDTGLALAKQFAETHQQVTAASSAWNKLGADKQQYIAQGLYALPPNASPDLVHQTFDAYDKQYKGDAAPITQLGRSIYDQTVAQSGPEAGRQALFSTLKGALTPETQQNLGSGSLIPVSTDKGTMLIQGKQGAAQPQGTQVGQTLAPPNQVVQTPTGRVGTANPASGTYQDLASPPSSPANVPPGETPDTVAQAQKIKLDASTAAAAAPNRISNNNQIIHLAKTADLGTAGAKLRGLGGEWAVVGNYLGTTQGVTDYHKIEHYLALEQGNAALSAGFNSDASRQIGGQQVGSGMTPAEALQNIARTNRALETGKLLFNDGIARASSAPGASGVTPREFRDRWANVVDMDALRLYDARRNKDVDPEGYKQAIESLGGPNSDRFKKTIEKIDVMNAVRLGQ